MDGGKDSSDGDGNPTNHPETDVSRKRPQPAGGHSPHEIKRPDQRTTPDTRNKVSDTSLPNTKRWSFKITNQNIGFDSPQAIIRSFADQGTDIRFRNMKLSHSKKMILLKVDDEHEPRIFNSMLKHLPEVANRFNMDLKLEYWTERTERPDPTLRHVIIRHVPNFLTEADVYDQLEEQYGENSIAKVVRVISRRTGEATSMVRIMCHTNQTAISIIADGVLMCGVALVGEKALSTPKITRCFRCQGVDHTQHNCRKPQKCGKCAEGHKTSECPTTDISQWRCANCNGTHGTSFHGCPCNQSHIEELRKREDTQSQGITESRPQTTNQTVNTVESSSTNLETQRTYAMVTTQNQQSSTYINGQETRLENIITDLKKTLVTMEKHFTEQIQNLSKEVKTLQEKNSRLTEKLETQEEIQNQARNNSEDIRAVRSETCIIKERVITGEDRAEERHEALTDELHWITAFLCKAINETRLKATHEQRIKGKLSSKYPIRKSLEGTGAGPKAQSSGKPKNRITRTNQQQLVLQEPKPNRVEETKTNNQQNGE